MEHTIDAKGKSLGRVASEAAVFLMGKNVPTYRRDRVSGNKILITNADSLNILPKKGLEKEYERYSGYPGGLTKETLTRLRERKGIEEIIKLAIYGMLPGNKLRAEIMKNIKIEK